MCGSSTLDDKPDYKAFTFSDNSQEMRALKRDTDTDLEIQRQTGDIIVKEVPQANEFTAWRDQDASRAAPSATCLSKPEGRKERKKHYTKNIVEEADTPELVAFFQEHNYQFVEAIFVDTEVPQQNNCLVGNHKTDQSFFDYCISNRNESTTGTLEIISCMSNESKLKTENKLSKDVIKKYGSKKTIMEDEEDSDAGEVIRLVDQSVEKISPETQLTGKEASRKADLGNSMPPCTIKVNNDNSTHTSQGSPESERENKSLTYHSDNINSRDEFQKHGYHQQLLETFLASNPEDRMPESIISSTQDFDNQRDQGESNSLFLSGPTAYSGQVPHSRSSSFHSNSSSSSFVFPILPSEWNGSPVRMVAADRKRLRKHRSWKKMLFLCSKF